jgi:hypothetical protein
LFWIWEWSAGPITFLSEIRRRLRFWKNYGSGEGHFWYSRDSWTGRVRVLGGYNHSVFKAKNEGFWIYTMMLAAGWERWWDYTRVLLVIHNHWSSKIEDR